MKTDIIIKKKTQMLLKVKVQGQMSNNSRLKILVINCFAIPFSTDASMNWSNNQQVVLHVPSILFSFRRYWTIIY